MRSLVVLVTVLAATAASPRERRQADDCFWWEPNCPNSAGPGDGSNPPDTIPKNNPDVVDNNQVTGEESYGKCNNGTGSCVPYYLCRENEIVTDGAGLLDIRFGGSGQEIRSSSECPLFLDVCCNHPETVDPTPGPYEPQCGRRNPDGLNARILGFKDSQAQFGEFPWMTAVLREEQVVADTPVNLFVCGGSLIHPSVVLTAAHCVNAIDTVGSLKVRAGEWDTQNTYEEFPHQDSRVRKVVVHPDFHSGALHNDYALLFLDHPFELAPNVDTICLPDAYQNFEAAQCWATGWGKDKFGQEGVFQNVLKKIQLSIPSHDSCQQSLRTTRLGKFFKLDLSFLCAGGEPNVDTCKGDGGSPLVCQDPFDPYRYVQAGIVAWGIGCGEDGVPGVYADVAYARDWIVNVAVTVLSGEMQIDAANYW